MKYESLNRYDGNRPIIIEGESIVEAIEKNWTEKILPHVKGNAAGCKVQTVELLAYDPRTKSGDEHFVNLRIVAKGQDRAGNIPGVVDIAVQALLEKHAQ